MKLVHKPLTRWISAACAFATLTTLVSTQAQQPEYTRHFDPAKGFKSAQANLTEIFLQIAGSLECYGSPEPYLRHMQKEHARIDQLFEQKIGKPHPSRMPSHMTVAYVDRLVRNWNTLSTPLGLEPFAKEIGRCMREGIMGTRLSGTLAVQIFNEHQQQVAKKMAGGPGPALGFNELKARLSRELELDREKIDMTGYDLPRRDAVSYALILDGVFKKKFRDIDAVAKPEKAPLLKETTLGVFLDLGYMAQSELEIGILDSGLKQVTSGQ